jgi:DNA-binding transcriptional LysR family regulator
MQTSALRYFAEVARSGSLRHASDVFDIVPSAISRQVAQLERQLGATLFERSARGMTLTEAGKLLLEYVDDGERRVVELRQRLDDLSELRRGTVRLAVVEATAHDFLPRVLEHFSRRHPGIEFRVTIVGTAEVAERLLAHEVDVALAFNSPSGDAPTMRELDGAATALPDRSFGIRRLVDQAAAAARIRLRIVLEANSLQLIRNMVAGSELVSFMPEMTFTREAAAGTLAARPLQGTAFSRASIDVLTARGHDLSHAARRFVTVLAQAARRGPESLVE